MEKWVVTAKRLISRELAGNMGIDPVIARIIRNRDITGDEAIEEYLNGNPGRYPLLETSEGH